MEQINDRRTLALLRGKRVPGFEHTVAKRARTLVAIVKSVRSRRDLAANKGRRLEKLEGFNPPLYSVRINDKWRVVFNWSGGKAVNIKVADYR